MTTTSPPSHLHDTSAVRQDPHAQQLTTPPSDAVDSTTTTTRMHGHALLLDGTRVYSTTTKRCASTRLATTDDSAGVHSLTSPLVRDAFKRLAYTAHPAAGAAANAVHDTRVVRAAHSPARRGALLNPKANRGKRALDAPHARCKHACDVERVAAAGSLRETDTHHRTERRSDAARGRGPRPRAHADD
ncbi:hypothetical protein DFH11DRAFT_1833947 [Phellopilus nigrolimitatus]|nr:hypothetical protein DFH11DRAFT_1833947 [Phellopilus nigrolimitatus]